MERDEYWFERDKRRTLKRISVMNAMQTILLLLIVLFFLYQFFLELQI